MIVSLEADGGHPCGLHLSESGLFACFLSVAETKAFFSGVGDKNVKIFPLDGSLFSDLCPLLPPTPQASCQSSSRLRAALSRRGKA